MITVKVDLSGASATELEIIFSLPHVGHAIDQLSHVNDPTIALSLSSPSDAIVADNGIDNTDNEFAGRGQTSWT